MASNTGKVPGKDLLGTGLLLVGGVVLPVLGWIIGAVLVLRSQTWSTRDKLIGLMLVPGGLALPLFYMELPQGASASCTGGGGPGRAPVVTCSGVSGGPEALAVVAVIILAATALVGPWWLLRQARLCARRQQSAA